MRVRVRRAAGRWVKREETVRVKRGSRCRYRHEGRVATLN